jgi:ketosteroid isomerase-like protein
MRAVSSIEERDSHHGPIDRTQPQHAQEKAEDQEAAAATGQAEQEGPRKELARAVPMPAESNQELLQELNKGYVDSVQDSDVAWFDQHLSQDFLNTNPDGTLVDRAGFLAQIAKPQSIKGLEPREVNIRILGEVAVIHAKTVYTKPDGQPGAGRYTDIWQKRDGRWVCIAAHVTRV